MTTEMVESAWAKIEHFLPNLDPDMKIIKKTSLKDPKRKYSEVFNRTRLNIDSFSCLSLSLSLSLSLTLTVRLNRISLLIGLLHSTMCPCPQKISQSNPLQVG